MTDSDPEATEHAMDDDGLSPSVKRLVRQYDIDITGIHGTGPDGRLRPSDIMALIGGGRAPETGDIELVEARVEPLGERIGQSADNASARPAEIDAAGPPLSVVFECDMSRVLTHQKREQESGKAPSLTSYVVVALRRALAVQASLTDALGGGLCVVLDAPDGQTTSFALDPTVVSQQAVDDVLLTRVASSAAPDGAAGDAGDDGDAASAAAGDGASAGADSYAAGDGAAAASDSAIDDDSPAVALTVRHHGLGGSLFAVPLPIAPGQLATLGIGKLQRVVGVKRINGADTPRVISQCYLSLSFRSERFGLERANRLLGTCVRLLEDWPLEPMPA